MDRNTTRSRRRVLEAAAGTVAVSTALVAGCNDQEDEDEPDMEEGTGNGQDLEDEDEDGDDDHAADDDDDLNGDEDDEATPEGEDADSWEDVEEILLATSEDQVWVGERPSLIEGEENPTLELVADREYEIGYEHRDEDSHNLSLWADDEDREATEVDDEENESHWLTVEATDDLTEYRCEIHPDEMTGEIEVTEA